MNDIKDDIKAWFEVGIFLTAVIITFVIYLIFGVEFMTSKFLSAVVILTVLQIVTLILKGLYLLIQILRFFFKGAFDDL